MIEISPIVYERELNWHDAMLYCSLLTVDNKNDWRLPTIYELRDIMDMENDFAAGYYWSSTENKYGNHAWNVGVSLWNQTSQKDDIYNVRAVREYLIIKGNNMNIEVSSKEYWKGLNYYDGLLYLSLLDIDGVNDWRMIRDDIEWDNIDVGIKKDIFENFHMNCWWMDDGTRLDGYSNVFLYDTVYLIIPIRDII